jgi:hypothetical protein
MKALSTLLLFCGILQPALAQISGKLTGPDGAGLPFVNVLLLNGADSSLAKGALTDGEGAYRIEHTAPGSYLLRVSSLGYQTWHSPEFELTAARPGKDMDTHALAEDTHVLAAVEVRAQKPLYQQEIDRTVVHVQSSVLTKGSSALQVLERSPGVMINRHSNTLTLNGKNDVMVMIDGKLTRLPAAQVIALLNSMSADNIQKIELITTPPAGYDAEGNAGLINIVTQKSEEAGTRGSFSLTGGYGMAGKGAGSLRLSHRRGKVTGYGTYSFSHDRSPYYWYSQGSQHMPAMGGALDGDFLSRTDASADNHNATLGLDLNLGKTTLGTGLAYNHSLAVNHVSNRGAYRSQPDSFLLMQAEVHGVSRWRNVSTNFYLEKQLREGEKINLDLDYLYYHNQSPTGVHASFSDRDGNEAEPAGALFSTRQQSVASTPISVGVVKFDYTRQLGGRLKMEAGMKGTHTESRSASTLQSLAGDDWVSSPTVGGRIRMQESIGAAYASFQLQPNPSVQLVAGARYEYSATRTGAEKAENRVERRFGKLFPSVFFSKKLGDQSDFQASYTKRISRPSYTDLASYVVYIDPMAVMTGNPTLRPTVSHTLKAGYNYRGYAFSVLLSHDNSPIVRGQLAESPTGDLLYLASQNLRYQNHLTFQANLPWRVTHWWSMNYGLTAGWREFQLVHTRESVRKTYFAYSLQGASTFTLPASFSLEVSGWYNSLSYDGSKQVNGFGMVNAGLKKELNHNRGSLQLSVSDLFKTMHIHMYFGRLTEEAFSVRSHVHYNGESRSSRIVKLTYAKSFGGAKIPGERPRSAGSREERDRVK